MCTHTIPSGVAGLQELRACGPSTSPSQGQWFECRPATCWRVGEYLLTAKAVLPVLNHPTAGSPQRVLAAGCKNCAVELKPEVPCPSTAPSARRPRKHGQNEPAGGVSGLEGVLQDPIGGSVHLDRVRGRRKLAAQLPAAALQRGHSEDGCRGHKRAARGGDEIRPSGQDLDERWLGGCAGGEYTFWVETSYVPGSGKNLRILSRLISNRPRQVSAVSL